jgi:AsmA protein
MARSSKFILVAAIGLVGLLAIVAAVLLFFVDANIYKSRLEAAASEALGMEVRVGGRVGIGFVRGLLVTLEDVHVRDRAAEVASAKKATLELEVLPLLWKEVRIKKIALEGPKFNIERDREGQFSFEDPQTAGESLSVLDWPIVSLSDGTLVYADKRYGERLEAGDCHLDVQRLRLSGGKRSDVMKNLSFTAQLACGDVRSEGFTVSNLRFSADAANGILDLKPVTMRVFASQGSGSIRADFSGAVPLYLVDFSLTQFSIGEFLKIMSPHTVAAGRMDFSAILSMQGKTWKQMRQSVQGQISMRGENLTLSGSDLDKEFARFESSQHFNLMDAGAFFFAGPLGLVVTKGYNFANILQGSGASSEIPTLVSDWKVERGVAQAQDVAMATRKNRIALHGGLDFVADQFDDVTVALVDAKGCAKVRQKIRGPFQKPVVENPSVLKSLTGPAVSLLKKGGDLFLGRKCDIFYAGSVESPK